MKTSTGLRFDAVGMDVSAKVPEQARRVDSGGDYLLVSGGESSPLASAGFDLILAAITFDNIPGLSRKVMIL